MALSGDNLLGVIEGPLGARGRCLDRLVIENTAARARFPSGALAIDDEGKIVAADGGFRVRPGAG